MACHEAEDGRAEQDPKRWRRRSELGTKEERERRAGDEGGDSGAENAEGHGEPERAPDLAAHELVVDGGGLG
ncbi:MAG: hypothetical protein U0166_05440 [Acidobacteriota bacterium]